MDHVEYLVVSAVREHGLPEGVLDPLDFLHADHHVFLRRRLTKNTCRHPRCGTHSVVPFPVLVELLLDLLKPGHHLNVLILHTHQLRLKIAILADLL